ncbi:hypothetical protein H2248_002452 [Termitomyces sp. 'cryptogamus']|nr:hypothetical protein H2248_002452 [Termitomyces sp. 'cryptogamus']
MILDTKAKAPPPPYFSSSDGARITPTLSTLPPHILLHIIYLTFPQSSLPDLPKLARQRKTLYWLSISLRLVDRTFYAACMHVLRSTHIPAYDQLVRAPYTSDPFPLLAPQVQTVNSSPYAPIPPSNQHQQQHASPLSTIQRETVVLDKFIALKVREDVLADESELHLERDEAYKDLFDHAQPRARLEDLVRVYGVQSGIICLGSSGDLLEGNGSVHMQARTSDDTLVPSQPQQEPDTQSKPRLFPPGSTYYTPTPPLLPTPHSHSSDASTSTHLTNKPSSAPTTKSVSNLFLSFFKSRQKPSAPPSPSSPSPTESSPFPSSTHPSHPEPQFNTTPIPMSSLTITLTPRSASLILADSSYRRTIVSTPRTRDEDLESVARRLVGQLGEGERGMASVHD